MDYYDVIADDSRYSDRWFLDEPRAHDGREIDAREFRYGKSYFGPQPAFVPIQQVGSPVKFNLGAFDMPVVSEDIARLIAKTAPGAVERFPVKIGPTISGYEIINVVYREDCVDEQRSEILRWKPEDGRPDKVGRYRMVSGLTIDPSRTHGRHIFRVRDWEVALIVSATLKEALERFDDLGVVFERV